MAHPRKSMDDKRVIMIRVRLTKAEKARLVSAAAEAGLTLSDYLRVKTLEAVPLIRKATPVRAELIRGLGQLGKIGSNVNQVARALNRREGQDAGVRVPVQIIETSLSNLDLLVCQLIQLVEHGH